MIPLFIYKTALCKTLHNCSQIDLQEVMNSVFKEHHAPCKSVSTRNRVYTCCQHQKTPRDSVSQYEMERISFITICVIMELNISSLIYLHHQLYILVQLWCWIDIYQALITRNIRKINKNVHHVIPQNQIKISLAKVNIDL